MQLPATLRVFRETRVYTIYVLFVLLLAYLVSQLERYTLPIVARPVTQALKFGDKSCLANSSNFYYSKHEDEFKKQCKAVNNNNDVFQHSKPNLCHQHSINVSCNVINHTNVCNATHGCKWDYDGTGLLYQVVAGPIFILVYTVAAIPLGLAADRYSRVKLLTVCMVVWSLSTAASGFCTAYWNLVLSRMGLAIGVAGCTPLAVSILSDYFAQNHRASAVGVYNWGIYTGYSLSFAIGNVVNEALGWRWAFFIAAIPGGVIALLVYSTIKEPQRGKSDGEQTGPALVLTLREKVVGLVKSFILSPSMLILCVAGGIRNGGGYVWSLNTETFYEKVKSQSTEQISTYMSWIPLVGGSLGVLVGGFISDRIVKRSGPHGRVWVLVFSQILAAPFCVGALFLSPPWCYLSLIPSNLIGEMWVSVTMTVVLELVPVYLRTSSVAVYFFIITNIGGNLNPLVSVIKHALGGTDRAYKFALLIMYAGLYVLGGLLFLLSLFLLKWDMRRVRLVETEKMSLLHRDKQDDPYDSLGDTLPK